MRGGTGKTYGALKRARISIHPPRAGRDQALLHNGEGCRYFNPPAPCGAGPELPLTNTQTVISIHPPRAGRDLQPDFGGIMELVFQSTRPVRGGTEDAGGLLLHLLDFNPPAPCGAGL